MSRSDFLDDFLEHLSENYDKYIYDYELDNELTSYCYDSLEFKPGDFYDIHEYLEKHGWVILSSI